MQTHRDGFTLIELLVVMSIVALLVAMLLPAVAKARDAAMLVKCSAQTRAITVASATYATDFQQNLPPGFGYEPGSPATLYQDSKDPGDYWIYFGVKRAGLLWPHYITNSEDFYCPSATGFTTSGQTRHANWAKENFYKVNSAAVVTYAYPAVKYEVAKTNSDGAWNGIAPQLWNSSNAMSYYTTWGGSMLEQKLEANSPSTPLSWDIGTGSGFFFTMHNGDAATIAYIDGSSIPFRRVRYIEQTLVWTFAHGMNHYSIVPTLRTYRESGTLP